MNKVISIILAGVLIAPLTFAYESCITPKIQKVDLYGVVREENLYEYFELPVNQRNLKRETQIILKLDTSICVISDVKKDKPAAIYGTKIALSPSAGISLVDSIGKQVEVKGLIILNNTSGARYPISITVESLKIIQ